MGVYDVEAFPPDEHMEPRPDPWIPSGMPAENVNGNPFVPERLGHRAFSVEATDMGLELRVSIGANEIGDDPLRSADDHRMDNVKDPRRPRLSPRLFPPPLRSRGYLRHPLPFFISSRVLIAQVLPLDCPSAFPCFGR